MVQFTNLWNNHVGLSNVCDESEFGNQCAMRMGKALEDSGVILVGESLKRCFHYSTNFISHSPGHIRSAQELANVFYHRPKLLGTGVKIETKDGSINDNLPVFIQRRGMVFIMNGWGKTDHIDVWDGNSMNMKGSGDTADYRSRGKQVWFWEII